MRNIYPKKYYPTKQKVYGHLYDAYELIYDVYDSQGKKLFSSDHRDRNSNMTHGSTESDLKELGKTAKTNYFAPVKATTGPFRLVATTISKREPTDLRIQLDPTEVNHAPVTAEYKGNRFTFTSFGPNKEPEKEHPEEMRVEMEMELNKSGLPLIWYALDEEGRLYRLHEDSATTHKNRTYRIEGLHQPKKLTLYLQEITIRYPIHWETIIQ
ncbi:hypothetical protein [Laceyella putida]|uniref:DUF3238 domain-containing protein n=1 Tax=Laceyella putida TaxID=110101 RepID=A0ABW2RFT7_9BACL